MNRVTEQLSWLAVESFFYVLFNKLYACLVQ